MKKTIFKKLDQKKAIIEAVLKLSNGDLSDKKTYKDFFISLDEILEIKL